MDRLDELAIAFSGGMLLVTVVVHAYVWPSNVTHWPTYSLVASFSGLVVGYYGRSSKTNKEEPE